ncbi:hypothetical protein Btru_045680 [Bulinus truncatus]|nr:hypothetical protein Btru_045680 [Bulinus truncatus]
MVVYFSPSYQRLYKERNKSNTTNVINNTTTDQQSLSNNITAEHIIQTFFHRNIYVPANQIFEKFNQSVFQKIVKYGEHLETHVTESGEKVLTENGVQYQSFLEKDDISFYISDFEAYIPFDRSLFFERYKYKRSINIKEKKIILWWQHKIAQAPINGLNPLRACPDFPCVLTSDRKYTENSSAMIVNSQFVNNESPPKRRLDQVFIHYQIEAPFNYWLYGNLFEKYKSWNEAFNWTMSYRMDADITVYRGLVRKRLFPKPKNYTKIIEQKSRLLTWIVSECHSNSKREVYVRKLQRHVNVDVYGSCGPWKCPSNNHTECILYITKKYKFILGFENNLCKDYITEKLYRYLNSDMIVIARGYNTYSRLVPSEIFLNTANFKSPKELADKIIYLDSDDQEYIQMLKEKDKYFTIFEDYPLTVFPPTYLEYRYEAVPMCDLCRRLWNLDKYSKSIKNMSEWFTKVEYKCQKRKMIL